MFPRAAEGLTTIDEQLSQEFPEVFLIEIMQKLGNTSFMSPAAHHCCAVIGHADSFAAGVAQLARLAHQAS